MSWNRAVLGVLVSFAAACGAMAEAGAATPGWPAGLPAALREAVRADAARRAGIPAETLELMRAEAVTWPNAALGCPQDGMSYTEALVRGWLVEVRAAGGKPMRYHANLAGTRWLPCEATRAQDPVAGDPSR